MYESFYHFSCKPFALNPDPSFLYFSPQHCAALTMLEYAMESQANFSLLTGDIGSGKTTVVRQLIRMLGESVVVGLISNTHQRFTSVVPWILSALDVVPSDDSDIAHYEALTDFVIRGYADGRRTLLIFDESQNLSVQALEELRLLSNINSERDIALQILLVGQPELRDKLERPELTQFAQRVSVDFHLEALSLAEARAYIRHRLNVAGGDPLLFDYDAILHIHGRSRGVPRLINQLCDLSLVYAFAERKTRINAQMVAMVIQDRHRGRAMRIFSGEPSVVPIAAKPAALDPAPTSKRI